MAVSFLIKEYIMKENKKLEPHKKHPNTLRKKEVLI